MWTMRGGDGMSSGARGRKESVSDGFELQEHKSRWPCSARLTGSLTSNHLLLSSPTSTHCPSMNCLDSPPSVRVPNHPCSL